MDIILMDNLAKSVINHVLLVMMLKQLKTKAKL